MKLGKRNAALIGAGIAGAMVLSACGGSDEGGSEEQGTEGAAGGTYTLAVNNPENPLVPGNTTETEGSQIVKALWTGLVEYNEDGELQETGVAESI